MVRTLTQITLVLATPCSQPAQTCTTLSTSLRNKHLANIVGKPRHKEIQSLLTDSVGVGTIRVLGPCSCLLDAVHTQNITQTWDASCLQRTLRTKMLSLIIPEVQEIIPFLESFELQFTAHSFLFYQESQENSKTHKLKQKRD